MKRVKVVISTYVTVAIPDNLDCAKTIEEVAANLDYNFTYDNNGVKIIDTEMFEVVSPCITEG
jgi:hypothetical protein